MKKIYVFFLFVMMISCFFSCDSQLDSSVVTVTDGTEIIEISLSEDGFKYSVRNNTVSIHGIDENTLVKLIIPEEIEGLPVTRIASEAFYNMDNIIEVVLPSTIKEIGERAFNNCKKLEKINLPSGLERIESYAFGATACTAIWIPATVIYYGYGIFPSKLTYVEIEEGATIFPPLSGTKINEITIPSSIKIIPAYAFPSTITEVVLPEGLERIEKWAFLDCSNITTIKLPSTIKFLGSSCFSGVPITQLELPDGIEELESGCFSGTKIEELYIPKSVKKIGSIDCSWIDYKYTLKKITFACDLTQDVINTDYPIIESPAMWLYDYPEEDENLSDSRVHNFKHRVELVFEDSVKTIAGIERSTFSGPFKSIDFGNGIERIEQGAFDVAVENVILPPTLKFLGSNRFTEVKNVTIQSYFEYAEYHFYASGAVLSTGSPFINGYKVDTNTGIYILEKDEYGWGERIEAPIENITFTENVIAVPTRLFIGSEHYLNIIKKVSGSNIQTVGDYAFSYCDIEDFDAPMEEVGERAFCNAKLPANADLSKITKYGCESFYGTIFEGEVVINKDAEFLTDSEGRHFTFWYSKMPSLTVNCNLPACWSRGVFNESTIGNLTFGPDATRIEKESFYQATISGTVDLNNVTYIGGGAFYECFDVEKFIFGHNPTTVKGVAFYSCNNAEFEFNGYVNLDMDSEFAFGNCYKLKNLPPFKPNTQITDNVFVNCVSIEELNLTNVYAFARAFGGCVNVERVVGLDSPIMEFDEENGIIYMNNDLDEMCYLVVAFNNLIPETFVIPSKVDVIASWAFAGLTNLKNISTEDSLLVILQSESFKDCTGLESFSLGYSQIGDNCFKGCTSLKNVTLNTQTIGSYAFADCTSLEKVTFTYTDAPKIGGYVFSGCTALKEIHDYMLWRGSGICNKNFWANCVNVEKYYAYYCSSASVWESLSQKKSSLSSYGALSIFSDVIEYVDLPLDEWNAVTWK